MRLALVIGVVVISTAIIVSGFFVVKNEKEKSKQSDERLKEMQVSMQKMETKLEEVNQETAKKIKEENVIKDSEESVIEKIVAQKPLEKEAQIEKNISCVLLDGSIEEVNELECEVLKNKDAMRKKIMDKYDECVDEVDKEFKDCADSSKNMSTLNKCMSIVNRDTKHCEDIRDEKLYNLK